MIPNIDERLASVVRALTEVILPHLPPEASLAQEQAQLAVGHLQIIRGQLDAAPEFERGELADAVALGKVLHDKVTGGESTQAARLALASALAEADGSDVRGQRKAIHIAVQGLVRAVSRDGDANGRATLSREILAAEAERSQKDRVWMAPFGFDTL